MTHTSSKKEELVKESNELFELCKHVYKATGWEDSYLEFLNYIDPLSQKSCPTFPVYTSDYLLKKLPRQIEGIPLCLWAAGRSDWMAEYDGTGQFEGVSERISMSSDTPLKSILRLTLKLHEEGLL